VKVDDNAGEVSGELERGDVQVADGGGGVVPALDRQGSDTAGDEAGKWLLGDDLLVDQETRADTLRRRLHKQS
jgi:hypothetical protein